MKTKKMSLASRIIAVIMIVVFIIANIAIYILFDDLTRVFEGTGFVISDSVESANAQQQGEAVAKQIVEEGIVLLRNENDVLPLTDKGNVNLFGWATVSHICGGSGGSGGATSDGIITIPQAMEDAGFSVNQELVDMYNSFEGTRGDIPDADDAKYGGYGLTWGLPEPDINTDYTDEIKESAKAFSDTAVVTIARGSGECIDIPEGYLSLTQKEKDLLQYVRDNYEKVIVVVNSNSVMELGYLEDINVDAVLFMPGTGAQGAEALGEILCGDVNPSGHLVDTMPYNHKESPSYYHANRPGSFAYSDEDDAKYVDYVEGIYVGYKYWETAAEEGYIDFDSSVQYPYGYGLSYTDFEQKVVSVDGNLNSDEIEVEVEITNTGDRAGKEVVQLYASAPYTKGGIEKASVDLVGFVKTGEIQPGEKETVAITVDPYEMASYDYNDANSDGKTGYILEKGTYELKLMKDSHNEIAVAETFELSSDITFDKDPVTGTEITNLFDEVSSQDETEPVTYLSRSDFAGTFPTTEPEARKASDKVKEALKNGYTDDENAETITTGADNGISFEELAGLDYDDKKWDEFLDQLTLDEMVELTKQGGFKTIAIDRLGVGATTETDGPQGVNAWWAFLTGDTINGVSYPSEMYLGQTWNVDLVKAQAEALAQECVAYNLSGMYAPAVNIHRTPYSGRNFEYYSEDGYQAGKLAAAFCYTMRENGILTYVKHFALNDQESWRGERFTGIFTFCTEQAMREIYLKPFEIAVKEGKTTAIMSSFNRVGYKWSGADEALCTELLRNEWGFRGMVLTDMYSLGNKFQSYEGGLRAGNDIWLTFFGSDEELKCDTSNPTTQQALRKSSHDILYAISECAVSPAEIQADWWYHIGLPIDIVYGLLIVLFIFWNIRKGKKENKEA